MRVRHPKDFSTQELREVVSRERQKIAHESDLPLMIRLLEEELNRRGHAIPTPE